MDLVYLISALFVPTATVIGLRVWFARSWASGPARAVVDLDQSELAQSVGAVRRQLLELSDQVETLSRDWEERDRRLTSQLNALLELTDRLRPINLSAVGDKPGEPGRPGRSGTRRPSRR